MSNQFFEKPILNSPYAYPGRHWELDTTGQPTQQIVEARRRAEFATPLPRAKKQKGACAFNYDAYSSEFEKQGRIPVLKAHMNADLGSTKRSAVYEERTGHGID